MPTISSVELARRCGVSQGTVDRALHDRPGISASTRDRVREEAARLGYVPQAAARALITGSHRLIGLILFGIDNQFTARVIRSIEESARMAGYELLIAFSNRDPALERRYLRRFLERRIDGIIVFPVTRGSEELEIAAKQKVPVVSLFNHLEMPQASYLGLDEEGAMSALAKRLSRKGCRRVAFMTYPVGRGENADAVERRRCCFAAAAHRCGIDLRMVLADQTPAAWDGIDAIACHNDRLAFRLLREIRSAKPRHPLPKVTGFDAADEWEPLAATFAVPYDAMARCAVQFIQQRKYGKSCLFKAKPQWNDL